MAGGVGRRPGAGAGAGPGRPPGGGSGRASQVYVQTADGKLKSIPVKTSITDGNVTAGETPDLKPGDEVVVGLATARAGGPGGGSPGGGGPRGMRM
jgi:multidrug efflux pump subunit AcrA (membrane-fusion protein)